ncbi:sugar transferase [Deinococcus yunweiensis]|uniref:sugar transferase n=1 Tax=Deinococcus yunweiensis TaxID=367282 RepID=UPI00398E9F46
MRILLITQWFEPEPTLKGFMFARELQRLGHEVEILTGFPNYPGGKLYPGYRVRPFQREMIEGIPVLRVPLYPSHDRSGARRALNYASFAASAAIGALLMRRPDVAYVYHPPATVGLPAIVLNALKGVPFVYDIQDLWPDTLAATGMLEQHRVLSAVGGWMNRIYRSAAHITVLSPGFKDRLVSRGVPDRKVTVVPNWTSEGGGANQGPFTKPEEPGFAGHFNVVFAGTMGKAQGLETVLDAAEELKSEPQVRFVMIGGGVEAGQLEASAQLRGLDNVTFLPRRPVSEISSILAAADALLVHLKDDALFEITIPSKTQAYMYAGKPILMGVRGDAASLIGHASAGVAFDPENAHALAQAVRHLAALPKEQLVAMGDAGRRYYDEHLSLRQGAQQFSSLLEKARWAGSVSDPIKRVSDFLIASLGLTIVALPMSVIALAVWLNMGSPVFYSQIRPGRFGHPFRLYKFRTMTDERGKDGHLLSDSERLTALGRFLRSSSLDELPELWNVMKGEMSLVGPRPLLTSYLPRYTDDQYRRHDVRPGITGWAQINGRQDIRFSTRIKFDVWYVENRTLWLDIKILLLTVPRMLSARGVRNGQDVSEVDDLGPSLNRGL